MPLWYPRCLRQWKWPMPWRTCRGSMEGFAEDESKAAELGCFWIPILSMPMDSMMKTTILPPVTSLSLPGSFFQNKGCLLKSGTPNHHFEAPQILPMTSSCHPQQTGDWRNMLMKGLSAEKPDIHQCCTPSPRLPTAGRNGMKLICVVMKDESPNQFTDTTRFAQLWFNNFEM